MHLKCLRQTGNPKRGILQALLRSMMQIDKRFVHVDYVDPNTGINARYTLRIVLAKNPLIKYLFIPMVNNILPSSITEIVTLIDSCGNYMYK